MNDPESFLDRDDVATHEETRTFNQETFEALRDRYNVIDGVVQVGVTTNEKVLLMGPNEWAPPGGDVGSGEDWEAAARRVIEELTGVAIEIDTPELIERTIFHSESRGESPFEAYVVTYRASLAGDETGFIDDPQVADDLDNKYIEDEEAIELRWFGEIPKDAHPNHEDHIQLFFENQTSHQ